MIGGKKIFTNTVVLVLSSIFNLGVSLITTALIARTLGPELYGKYTFGLSYILLFSVLANFGIESLFIREGARDRSNISSMAMDILHLKFVLAILTIIIIILSVNILKYPKSTINVVYILCVGLFFQILYSSFMSVYKSLERMSIIALIGVVFRVVTAIMIVGSIYLGWGLMGIVATFSMGNALVCIGSGVLFYKDFKIMHLKFNPHNWISLIRGGIPFYISALLTMVYLKINVLMLSKMRGELEVGFYMASATLVESLFFMPDAFNTSIFPAFSRIYGVSFDALKVTFKRAMKYLILVTTAVVVGTLLVGERIVVLIYGEKFLDSVGVLRVLIFFWALMFFSQTMSNLLFSIKKEKSQMIVMGLACVFNIISNLFLINYYGFLGSSYAQVLSEASVVLILGVILWKNDLRYLPDASIMRLVLVLFVMAITVRMLIEANILITILGGATSYMAALFILRVFDSDDRRAIRSIIKRQPVG